MQKILGTEETWDNRELGADEAYVTVAQDQTDYLKYRGKCKEMCEALIANDPSLRLVRGHYYCPIWRSNEQHWWCEDQDGMVVDPTKDQFPSKGLGFYVEFDGMVECSNCGKEMNEDEIGYSESRYVFCSYECYGRFVGVI